MISSVSTCFMSKLCKALALSQYEFRDVVIKNTIDCNPANLIEPVKLNPSAKTEAALARKIKILTRIAVKFPDNEPTCISIYILFDLQEFFLKRKNKLAGRYSSSI